MTQSPPPFGHPPQGTYIAHAKPSNPMAIVSLICGIIGCLGITALISIVTGFLALGKSKTNGGKGMAIAGIILSLLWIVGGTAGGYVAYRGGKALVAFVETEVAKTAKEPAKAFLNTLAEGDTTAAAQLTSLDAQEVQSLADKIKPLGKCQDISIQFPSISNVNGVVTASFTGQAVFDNGTKDISASVMIDEHGTTTIQNLDLK